MKVWCKRDQRDHVGFRSEGPELQIYKIRLSELADKIIVKRSDGDHDGHYLYCLPHDHHHHTTIAQDHIYLTYHTMPSEELPEDIIFDVLGFEDLQAAYNIEVAGAWSNGG